MDPVLDSLVARIHTRLQSLPPTHRFLVGIAGSPGSGKTTLALKLVERLSAGERGVQPVEAVLVGMDGWHHTREALSGFPDPEEAFRRRGAAFTFDAASYSSFIDLLRSIPIDSPTAPPLLAPSFDHALKDPTPDGISIPLSTRVVALEGNYVLLDAEPWARAARTLDERVFVDVDRAVARGRLVARHVRSGICQDAEEAGRRADDNDLPNGDYIKENLVDPTMRVISTEDAAFAA